MKTMFKATLFAASLFAAGQTYAQDHSVGHKIGTAAKTVGHKTSEVAAKGDAAVVDKKYSGWKAPGGQTVYINKHSQYYYIDKKGHRNYLKKSQLVINHKR